MRRIVASALAVAAAVLAAAAGAARAEPEETVGFPADPEATARSEVELEDAPPRPPGAITIDRDTWIELHGYARMPVAVQTTPRQPFLVDSDYYLSGFAYTRLYEPDWSEVFLSAHH